MRSPYHHHDSLAAQQIRWDQAIAMLPSPHISVMETIPAESKPEETTGQELPPVASDTTEDYESQS